MKKMHKSVVVSILALAAAGLTTAVAADTGMQRCMGIADSLKRLDCFEKLARSRGSAEKPADTQPRKEPEVIQAPVHPLKAEVTPVARKSMVQIVPGKTEIERWLIKVSVDPIHGGAQVALRNKAVKGRNQYAVPVELKLECKGGRPLATVLWREPMLKGEVPVLLFDERNVGEASEAWRMDEKSENWLYSGDFQALMQALASHQKASGSVQVMEENINFEDDIINAWFNISGAEFALKPLKKACF